MQRPKIPRPKSGVGALVELVAIVALAVGLALLIQAFVVKPYQIPSPSMVPTLEVGQRVLVNRFIYHLKDPEVGDIVVFHPPVGATGGGPECGDPKTGEGTKSACALPDAKESDQNFIKRIVALPGDRLYIKDGHPVVNGKEADENFINPCKPATSSVGCNWPKPITIPPNDYFMMGDNRGKSDDSRLWGPVPRDWLIGEAFLTYWPPDRIGFL
jgi:signal peptidase I